VQKLHTVAATIEISQHDHSTHYLFLPLTYVLFFVHISFAVNCTFNAMLTESERLQQWW